MRERPDWVCEILSPSTARYDAVQNQRTLHARGVPHYWLVNPEHEPFDAIELDVTELFGHEAAVP